MTLKLLAPLALLLGILGGGTSNMKMSYCASGADYRDTRQACRSLTNTSAKVNDCCGCECCIPGQECCGACCLK
jgi:hypothetical protein